MSYPVDLHVFGQDGCPNCAALDSYLESIQSDYPEMTVHHYDVRFDQTSRDVLADFEKAYDMTLTHVPATFIDDKYIIGFDQQAIQDEIDRCTAEGCEDPWEFVYGKNLLRIVCVKFK